MIKTDNLKEPELMIYNNSSEVFLKTINEPAPGLFIAESPKVIMRAIAGGYEPVSVLVDEALIDNETNELIGVCNSLKVPVYEATHRAFADITGANFTRGALAAFKRKPYVSPELLINGLSRIAILEDVVNPTNVGAIFRSAAALGMEAVILTENSTDPLYRRASRVSMGTVFQIPYTFIGKDGLEKIKAAGFKTVSFALRNNSVDIDDDTLKKEEKLAIIMGTEGDGLKTNTIEESDYVVKIPMSNEVDSLNVAAAAAVAFWELGRKK